MKRMLLPVLAAILLASFISSTKAATAEAIFKATSRGVVLIRDLESHGSGVVLTSKGNILTSYHVVNTPLPLEVTAEVYKSGKRTSMTFKKVTVVSVHKEYDLAIINVQLPAGVTLKPLPRSSRAPSTGEQCFVIGNPGGAAGQALRNSISTGIIGASERVMEDKKYIQTTAAINPGNSGGALVDKYGKLIGIIAFIISDTEGIGFAIPIKGLKMSHFIKEVERVGNIQKAIEYEKIGSHWYRESERLSGEQKEFALIMAYTAYRLSLAENSNDSSPYNNLGNIYVKMGEHETGKFFFEKAVELDKRQSPLFLKMLGICEDATGNLKKADELWKEGVLCKKDDMIRGECAENLAISAIKAKNFPDAAYLIKWANTLGAARPSRKPVRNNIYQEAVNKLSDKQFQALSNKTTNFSFKDMALFAKGRIKSTAVASTKTSSSRRSSKSSPGISKKLFEKALAGAPEPPAEGLKKKMPEAITDCRPAFGGVYLVMKFPEMKKLGIFNIAQVKFEKYIPISNPDCIYACGGRNLIIYDQKQKIFQIYDMTTFKRTGSKMSRMQGVLTDINMGLMLSDKAVVSWAEGSGALDNRHYGLMEIPSMKITPFRTDNNDRSHGFRNTSYRNNVHIRLDPQMKRFVSWCTSHSPSGFIYGSIDGLRVSSQYEHSSYGSLSLLSDPSRIVGSAGKLMDTKGSVQHDFKNRKIVLFAVTGANMVIKVEETNATIVDALNLTEVQSFTLPFKMKSTSWNKNDLTDDRLVFASAHLNRAAFIDNSGLQIIVHKLSGGSNSKVLAEQLEGVPAGTLWTRKLEYPKGTKISLEDAPDGVKFSSSKMTLTWQIPRAMEKGSHQILLSVIQPGKDEVYQRVSVTIR